MTTAGRPTYFSKVGSSQSLLVSRRTYMQSGKDQTAHTKLKYRQVGQASVQEIRNRDLKDELEKKEQAIIKSSEKNAGSNNKQIENASKLESSNMLLLANVPHADMNIIKKYDDSDAVGNNDDDFESSDEEEDEDDEDDDEAALQAELEKIKAERLLAQQKKEQEELELMEKSKQDSAVKGNPLLQLDGDSAKIKRRWNDDVVFRNQARDEPEMKKRFINDTVRNDFHRLFLKKYVH